MRKLRHRVVKEFAKDPIRSLQSFNKTDIISIFTWRMWQPGTERSNNLPTLTQLVRGKPTVKSGRADMRAADQRQSVYRPLGLVPGTQLYQNIRKQGTTGKNGFVLYLLYRSLSKGVVCALRCAPVWNTKFKIALQCSIQKEQQTLK